MADFLKTDAERMEYDRKALENDIFAIKELLYEMQNDISKTGAIHEELREDINTLLRYCSSIEGLSEYHKEVEKEYTKCENEVFSLISDMERSV